MDNTFLPCWLCSTFQSTKIVKMLKKMHEHFENWKVFGFFGVFGFNIGLFHWQNCKKLFGKAYWTTHSFFVDPFQCSNSQSLSEIEEKMQKFFENWKILRFLSFSVSICYIFSQKTKLNASEKPTGQHVLSLLTFFNVPIHKVCQKFEKKKWHKTFANWKIQELLSYSVFVWDIFK